MNQQLATDIVFNKRSTFLIVGLFVLTLLSIGKNITLFAADGNIQKNVTKKKPAIKWNSLFDGKTLKGWKKTNFGGEGEVEVKEGVIIMDLGNDLTGIHTDRKLPKINYEVELQAKRIEGNDFFCGFTFPVNKKSCSLILGGWGGTTVGLSSIDDMDASENDTTQYLAFKKNKWYKIRLRVTESKIEVWLDGKSIIEQETKDRKISIRAEVDPSQPFGFACYQTTAGLKEIKIRELTKTEIKKSKIVKQTKPKKQGSGITPGD